MDRCLARLSVVLCSLLFFASGSAVANKTAEKAEAEVRFVREIWLDPARQRHVNVRIAMPSLSAAQPSQQPLPLMLFSAPQGFRWGGYYDHYEELSREMVRRGVVMVTVAHYDIDEPLNANEKFSDVYPGILTGPRNDPSVDRFEDWLFVLREIKTRNDTKPKGWPALDLDRLAVGGHSSGTLTALQLAGMPVRDREGRVHATHRDARIKAFVIYSYPLEYRGPRREDLKQVGAVAGLHVAGFKDNPHFRNTSYRYVRGAPQYWLVADGDHNVGATGSEELILEVTGNFIDGYLNGKAEQRELISPGKINIFRPGLRQYQVKTADARLSPDHRDFVAWARETLPWGRWLHNRAISQNRNQDGAAK